MLWVKALHVFFVVAWFAGLFYLPRLFVNFAARSDPAVREALLAMAQKLYRFMTAIAIAALGFGLWLWLGYGIGGAWLHVKLVLVVALIAFHMTCGILLRNLARGEAARSERWYRIFNEVPAVALLGIVILAVVKPF